MFMQIIARTRSAQYFNERITAIGIASRRCWRRKADEIDVGCLLVLCVDRVGIYILRGEREEKTPLWETLFSHSNKWCIRVANLCYRVGGNTQYHLFREDGDALLIRSVSLSLGLFTSLFLAIEGLTKERLRVNVFFSLVRSYFSLCWEGWSIFDR